MHLLKIENNSYKNKLPYSIRADLYILLFRLLTMYLFKQRSLMYMLACGKCE